MATIKAIYRLPGRQAQGFLQSVFELMKLNLPVPDHSTLSRRLRRLEITLPVRNLSNSLHLVIDSTGVKIYGEGEWKVRQHGVGKRRTWRKLHFCSDEATLEIVSVVASTNNVSDADGRHANTKAERRARDENLRRIRKIGRKEWKRESNYHRRSLAGTQVFRFKTIFGDRLQTRQIDNQFKELMLKTALLNRMTHLGMPE
jgi:hypothetical protein